MIDIRLKNRNLLVSRPRSHVDSHQRIWDYIVVFLLICVSGHVFVVEGGHEEYAYVIVAGLFTILLFNMRLMHISRGFFLIVTVFLLIQIIHALSFDSVNIKATIGWFTRLYIAYIAVILVAEFMKSYICVMTHLCILSFCFHIPNLLSEKVGSNFKEQFELLHNIFGSDLGHRYDIGVHNFMVLMPERNAGLFWEPGAFAGFILLAIAFLGILQREKDSRRFRIQVIILVSALISTISAIGYVVLPLALLLVFRFKLSQIWWNRKMALSALILVLPALMAATLIWKRPLMQAMQEKFIEDIELLERQEVTVYSSRISCFTFHWEYIRRRPLTGWGRSDDTYMALHPNLEQIPPSGNGILRFLHQMGILGLGTFMVFLFFRWWRITGDDFMVTSVFVLVVIMILQGEDFLSCPMFLSLMFIGDTSPARQFLNHRPILPAIPSYNRA